MNHKLNFLKCFACIGVVFIHITFPDTFGQIVSKVSAFAVPIFFMIAGYYAFGSDAEVIKRRLFKIARIFVFAYFVFFAYDIVNSLIRAEAGVVLSSYFSWNALVKAVCFCTIDFAIPLWYLIAMSEAYIAWYIAVKNKKEQTALKSIPILFVLQILLISYCDTMQLAWFWKTNFITRAMPWFLLGYYMHTDKAEKFRNIDSYKLMLLAASGCVVTIIPTAFALSFDFSSVGYIPYAFGLFALSLKNPNNSICKPIEYIGNKLSLNIYIFHVPIGSVVGFCVALLGIDTTSTVWMWCRPIVVLISAVFVSWMLQVMLNTLKQRKKQHKISS